MEDLACTELREIIESCWAHDASIRPTAVDALNRLQNISTSAQLWNPKQNGGVKDLPCSSYRPLAAIQPVKERRLLSPIEKDKLRCRARRCQWKIPFEECKPTSQRLGRGEGGEVWEADWDNHLVAMKKLRSHSDKELQTVQRML